MHEDGPMTGGGQTRTASRHVAVSLGTLPIEMGQAINKQAKQKAQHPETRTDVRAGVVVITKCSFFFFLEGGEGSDHVRWRARGYARACFASLKSLSFVVWRINCSVRAPQRAVLHVFACEQTRHRKFDTLTFASNLGACLHSIESETA